MTGFYGVDAADNNMAKVMALDRKPKERAADFAAIIQEVGDGLSMAPSDIALSAAVDPRAA